MIYSFSFISDRNLHLLDEIEALVMSDIHGDFEPEFFSKSMVYDNRKEIIRLLELLEEE